MDVGHVLSHSRATTPTAVEHGRFALHHAGRQAHAALPHRDASRHARAEDVGRAGRDDAEPVAGLALANKCSPAVSRYRRLPRADRTPVLAHRDAGLSKRTAWRNCGR